MPGSIRSTSCSTPSEGSGSRARPPPSAREAGWYPSPTPPPEGIDAVYFVVEPNLDQLVELTRLAEDGALRPEIDSVYPLEEARAAFERSMAGGKRGKVVLRVVGP